MKGIYFEKVSFETFLKDVKDNKNLMNIIRYNIDSNIDDYIKECYDNIKLPVRKTKCSAGYDFIAPFDIEFKLINDDTIKIPTGIKAHMPDDIVLMLHIRSSHGIGNGLQIANTTGVIDADYYNNPDNEGDIIIALRDTKEDWKNYKEHKLFKFDRVVQGVFLPYYTTEDDYADGERVGGIGSTN